MRVLFVGDVFGKPGRRILRERLPRLLDERDVDFCLANVENAAGGFGITPQITEELLNLGIDVLTSGNHIWDKKAIIPYLAQQPKLLRPQNYPPSSPGSGTFLGTTKTGINVAVLNIQGRVYMPAIDCPFRVGEAAVRRLRSQAEIILVDFHGEATSEKQAFAWYLDGQISAVAGTHTHVQTADERILPMGTAYISDLGMTGPYDSVIGSIPDFALERFVRQIPVRLEPAKGNTRICGAVVEVDEKSGLASSIERINIGSDGMPSAGENP
jgi:metallophosphoesterase (TIGR00282 family)